MGKGWQRAKVGFAGPSWRLYTGQNLPLIQTDAAPGMRIQNPMSKTDPKTSTRAPMLKFDGCQGGYATEKTNPSMY